MPEAEVIHNNKGSIDKRVAAIEVYKVMKTLKGISIISFAGILITYALASQSNTYSIIFLFLFLGANGYTLFKSEQQIRYLKKTYDLT